MKNNHPNFIKATVVTNDVIANRAAWAENGIALINATPCGWWWAKITA